MSDPRLLWIDKTGQPVVTTTANGERNARRWGWTPAQAIPSDPAPASSVAPEAAVEALDALVEIAKVGVVGSVRQRVDDLAKDARAGLAVVREHLPVKPDREAVARAQHRALMPQAMSIFAAVGGTQADYDALLDTLADAVLDLLPGRSEAEVKAEALREAGRWLVSIGYVMDYQVDIAAPDALWEAFVDAAHQDADGTVHGNTLTRTEVDDWLSGEAGRPARARADRLAAEGGDDRG